MNFCVLTVLPVTKQSAVSAQLRISTASFLNRSIGSVSSSSLCFLQLSSWSVRMGMEWEEKGYLFTKWLLPWVTCCLLFPFSWSSTVIKVRGHYTGLLTKCISDVLSIEWCSNNWSDLTSVFVTLIMPRLKTFLQALTLLSAAAYVTIFLYQRNVTVTTQSQNNEVCIYSWTILHYTLLNCSTIVSKWSF